MNVIINASEKKRTMSIRAIRKYEFRSRPSKVPCNDAESVGSLRELAIAIGGLKYFDELERPWIILRCRAMRAAFKFPK